MEIARVLGWRVCVKKGEFKPGDWCVYCEIDSIMPEKPEYEFLRTKHFRIKTIKLRGQVSQGICFPLTTLVPGAIEVEDTRALNNGYTVIGTAESGHLITMLVINEGQDVTEKMGVTKYEPPAPQCQDAKGNFPTWITKTDQTRIQAIPQIIERYQGVRFIVSEKLDGSSMTVYLKDGVFGVCSRNLELKEGSNPWWNAAKMLNLEERMRHIGQNVALQGEVLINGNWYYPGQLTFRLFDIYNIDKSCYYDHKELTERAKVYGVETAPQLFSVDFDKGVTVDSLVQLATMKSTIQPTEWLEGLVFNPETERNDLELGRLSFKVINPEYDMAH